MYNERTPLYREPKMTYTSPYRRYNKMGIVNCISCAILGMLTAALLILMIAYFEMSSAPIFPPSQDINGSLSLSLENANISSDQIMEAFNLAEIDLNRKEELDRENPTLNFDSPSYKHQQTLKGEIGSYAYSRKGYLLNRATNYLIKEHPEEKMTVSSIKSPNWLDLDFCDENEEKCDFPYRKIDGYCNNKKHPKTWGVAMRPFARAIPAEYCDGVELPRCAKDEKPLPSARTISVELHRPEYKTDPNFTYMFAIWGQFIDHDISSTALNKGVDGQYLSCCGGVEHPECYPVNISSSDAYYSQFGVDCMEFVRSAPSPTCSLGPREQLNQVTSYLDGSVVYGNTEALANNLREFSGGRLRMHFTKDGRELLPVSLDLKDGCNREEEAAKGRYCFLSGDSRANENLHLTTMHLIMARQHNKIASKLSNLNPMWEDEKIYQESKKIVSAQMQHITYNEFLTPLLGEETMKKYKLNPDNYEYNENTDASMNNNFASAAFRFAHTLLPKLMKIGSNNDMTPELVELHKILFNPFKLYDAGSVDAVVEGAIGTKADKLDQFFNTEMTQHLFENEKPTAENKMCGLDLVTLNLQRGRDHGLPGYTKWRKYCGLSEVKSFADLDKIMDQSSIQVLKTYYKDVDDIDLYSGALSEVPSADAILGPTTTCLIAKQFNKIKLGDRYWYESSDEPHSFTKEQIGELKKTTLASILCENSDSLKSIRTHVMKTMASESDEVNCDALDQVNLKYWSDSNMNDVQMRLQGDGTKPKKPSKPAVIKMFASASLLTGEIYGSYGDNEPIKLFDGTLPAIVYTDNFTDPDAYDVSAAMEWEGIITNDLLSGTFTIPVTASKVAPGATTAITNWKGNFTALFKYKWGGSLSFVEPHKTYKCKLMFTAFGQKATYEGLRLQESVENCKIMLEGTFYKKPFYCYLTPWWCTDDTIYYWNGEVKLSITKPAPDNVENLKSIEGPVKPIEKQFTKTVTSLAVVGGEVTGSYDGGNSMKVFDGSLPVDINTEILQGSYDYFTVTDIDWEAKTVSNDAISGTFSVPLKTADSAVVKYWKGSFTTSIRYKWGDQLETIEPNKMQKCKVMFIPDHEMLAAGNIAAMEMKFEFCIVKLSGKFVGKVFTWNGDMQLMMKRTTILGAGMVPKKAAGSYASVMVVGGEVTATTDGGSTMRLFDGTLPMTINTQNFLGPYPNLALHTLNWEGQLSNDTLMGTYTLPMSDGMEYKGNFALTFKYLKGMLNVEPHKNYKCKIILVPQHLMQDIESSGCTIKLMGTFVGNDFTWDGNAQLTIKSVPMQLTAGMIPKKAAGSYASMMVVSGEVSGTSMDGTNMKLFDGTLPATINTENFLGPYPNLALQKIDWEGHFTSNETLSGTYSLPLSNGFISTGSFVFTVKYLKGSINVEPNKNYKCKVVLVPQHMMQAVESSGCTIKLMGTFVGNAFTWDGNVQMTMKSAPMQLTGGMIPKAAGSYASVMVVGGDVTATSGGSTIRLFDGSLPMTINTQNFLGPYPNLGLHSIDWEGQLSGNSLMGTYTLPMADGTEYKGNFALNFMYVKGMMNIEPHKNYKCKIVLVPQHLMQGIESSGCTIKLMGTFVGNAFTWDGNVQLMIKSAPPMQLTSGGMIPKAAGSYASVMVVGGDVTSTTGGSTIRLFDGSLPMTINTQNFLGPYPNLGLHSIDWEGQLTGNSLMGTYTLPMADGTEYKGSFSLNFVYVKGMMNIEPHKNYKCKIVLVPQHLMQGIESSGCTIKLMGTFVGNDFTWDGNVQLMIKSAPPIQLTSGGMVPKAAGSYASVMVVGGDVTSTTGGSTVRLFDGSLPMTINTQNFLGPYPNLALHSIDWEGQITGNSLMGTYTLLMSNGMEYKGSFSLNFMYLKGMINIEPHKNYKCKIILVPQHLTQGIESSGCTIKLMGTFVGNDFTWDGNVQLMIKTVMPNMLSPKMYNTAKIVKGEVLGILDGVSTKLFDGTLPVSINTANFMGPYPNLAFNSLEWETQMISGDTLLGTYSMPLMSNGTQQLWKGSFALTLEGDLLNMIEANKLYKCKVILVPQHEMLSSAPSSECVLKLSGTFMGSMFTWDGNLQLTQPSQLQGKNMVVKKTGDDDKPAKPEVIKMYASVSVETGKITASYDGGEPTTLFDGEMPAEVYYGNFTNPNSYDVSADIEWQGMSMNNKTVSGTFTLPITVGENVNQVTKYWKGNFTAQISSLWAGSLDVIEPHKIYKCKLMFTAFKQSKLGKTIKDPESCAIMAAGWFYEKPFYCFITPFCGDDKIYYWNGDVELILRKPVTPNLLGGDDPNLNYNTFVNLHSHTIEGKVLSGSLTLYKPDETLTWNGNLPVNIQMPLFWQKNPDMTVPLENSTAGIPMQFNFFQSTISGTFKLPQYSKSGMTYLRGKFSFELSPLIGGSFYDMLVPDVEYLSALHFHDQDKKMPVLFQENLNLGARRYMNMSIIVLGSHANKITKTISWDGKFLVIVNNIPYYYRFL